MFCEKLISGLFCAFSIQHLIRYVAISTRNAAAPPTPD